MMGAIIVAAVEAQRSPAAASGGGYPLWSYIIVGVALLIASEILRRAK